MLIHFLDQNLVSSVKLILILGQRKIFFEQILRIELVLRNFTIVLCNHVFKCAVLVNVGIVFWIPWFQLIHSHLQIENLFVFKSNLRLEIDNVLLRFLELFQDLSWRIRLSLNFTWGFSLQWRVVLIEFRSLRSMQRFTKTDIRKGVAFLSLVFNKI